MRANRDTEELEGDLDKVVYESPDGQFVVANLLAVGGMQVRVVGELSGARPGEHLRCQGRWVADARYGRQFRVESFTPVLPSSAKGIRRYLATAGIKGVGDGMAERIVEKFGEQTLEVIEREPHRLSEVDGIGPARARALGSVFAEQRTSREVLVFLHSFGLGPALARKVYKAYGDRAIAELRDNPYRMAQDIVGVGFRTADRLAREMGFDLSSPERAAAAALHVLLEAKDDGHLYLPRAELTVRCDALDVPANALDEGLDALAQDGQVRVDGAGSTAAIYLPRLYRTERQAAARLATLLTTPGPDLRQDGPMGIDGFEERSGLRLSEGQRKAILKAIESKVFVLTGGPGTGKTTMVNALLALLSSRGLRIHLAAPTGRAAKRMEEASGFPARTLHRLLEFNPRTGGFQRGPDNQLTTDAVIVDESSMVDLMLFNSLLGALPCGARLYLVGDVDQLPSVGAGDVLRDVIGSGVVPTERLNVIFRQEETSSIVENAHLVNRGEMPQLEATAGDFFHVARDDSAAAARTILELVQERIPGKFGFDPRWDIQVLSPMYRGQSGVENLNRILQQALNPVLAPSGAEALVLTAPDQTAPGLPVFRCGDKVLQRRNNYEKEVFNGDVGRIVDVDIEAREVLVEYDGRSVQYQGDEVEELQLAYALSVHKSQGSEYPVVVLALLKEHFPMLQRNLLYTALTRAKKLVVVVGQRRAVEMAVRNASQRERYTRLTDRLRDALIPEN